MDYEAHAQHPHQNSDNHTNRQGHLTEKASGNRIEKSHIAVWLAIGAVTLIILLFIWLTVSNLIGEADVTAHNIAKSSLICQHFIHTGKFL